MKVLLVDDELDKESGNENLKKLDNYLKEESDKDSDFNYFTALSKESAIDLSRKEDLGPTDISFVDVILKDEDDSVNSDKSYGIECAIELYKRTNVIMMTQGPYDKNYLDDVEKTGSLNHVVFLCKTRSDFFEKCIEKLKNQYERIEFERYWHKDDDKRTFGYQWKRLPHVFFGYPYKSHKKWEHFDPNKIERFTLYFYHKDHYGTDFWERIFHQILFSSFFIFEIDEINLNVFFEIGLACGLGREIKLYSTRNRVITFLNQFKTDGFRKFNITEIQEILDHQNYNKLEDINKRIKKSKTGSLRYISYYGINLDNVGLNTKDVIYIYANDPKGKAYYDKIKEGRSTFDWVIEELRTQNIKDLIKKIIKFKGLIVKISEECLNVKKRKNREEESLTKMGDILTILAFITGVCYALEKPLRVVLPDGESREEFSDLGNCRVTESNTEWVGEFLEDIERRS